MFMIQILIKNTLVNQTCWLGEVLQWCFINCTRLFLDVWKSVWENLFPPQRELHNKMTLQIWSGPSQSPDLNRIQRLWDELEHWLWVRPYHSASLFTDLTNALVAEWKAFADEICDSFNAGMWTLTFHKFWNDVNSYNRNFSKRFDYMSEQWTSFFVPFTFSLVLWPLHPCGALTVTQLSPCMFSSLESHWGKLIEIVACLSLPEFITMMLCQELLGMLSVWCFGHSMFIM